MTEPETPRHDGRMDTLMPGVPLAATAALLAGLAGGLFAAILMSYIDNRYQYHVLAAGLLLGLLGAILLILRERRRHRSF